LTIWNGKAGNGAVSKKIHHGDAETRRLHGETKSTSKSRHRDHRENLEDAEESKEQKKIEWKFA
jgi:hypothetical protein